MTKQESIEQLANATEMTLDEAAKAFSEACSTFEMELTEEQQEALRCPWWKFWNGWFIKY